MITGWQATSNLLMPDIQNFSTITIDGSSNTVIYQNCLSWKTDKRRGRGYSWMNPGVRYCIWLQYLRSSFCSPQESITPLHKGQLRGQEGKSAKKAQGRRRIKIKKSPKEVQHPVLNHGCFLMKPALLLSNQSHLWSPQSPARKKKALLQMEKED